MEARSGLFYSICQPQMAFCLMASGSSALPLSRFMSCETGRINTLSIPDRIGRSETCQHLHTSSQPSWVGFREGVGGDTHSPLSAGNTKGHWDILDATIWHLMCCNGSISLIKRLSSFRAGYPSMTPSGEKEPVSSGGGGEGD